MCEPVVVTALLVDTRVALLATVVVVTVGANGLVVGMLIGAVWVEGFGFVAEVARDTEGIGRRGRDFNDGVVDVIEWLVPVTEKAAKGGKIEVVLGESGVFRRGRTSLMSHSGSFTRAAISWWA